MTGHPVPLTASHSHLFRGARLRTSRSALALPLRPADVRLAFSDGVELPGELVETGDGDALLSLPGYRTAAGASIGAALWPVLEVTDDADPAYLNLRLGPRIDG